MYHCVDELFVAFVSATELTAVAVLLTIEPFGALEERCAVNCNIALAAGASGPIVQVIVPVVPAAGVVQPKVGVVVDETKVMFAGSTSVSVTVVVDGPLLITFTLYVAFVPAVIVAGPFFVTATSASGVIVVDTEDELLKRVVAHAAQAHGVTDVTPELAAKVKSAIRDHPSTK